MLRSLSTALCVSLALQADAQSLSPALSSFAPLVGRWSCSGHNAQTPGSPGFDYDSEFRFEPVLRGQFLRVRYSESVEHALPFARDNVEYWEADGDGFRSTYFNAFGTRGELRARGFEGDALTWAGKIATPDGPLDFEGRIVLREPARITITPTLLLPDGAEFAIAEISCRKAAN